ncbi:kinase-like domain-containing protein, partial [Amanita rubescens]
MWRSLNHKFVLPFLGIYEHEPASQFFLVSPYMENGTLAQWRKKANPSVAEIEERILEVAQGIEYIHSQGVVHGDLRGANILLDPEFHVQIADFGLTRLSEATATQSGALHYNFAAPELFGYTEVEDDADDDTARTYKSDVFAFGRLYYEIYYGTTPFAGIREIQVMKLVCGGVHPPRLDEPPLSDWVWELIRWCWDKEAMRRPMISDVAARMLATLGSNSRPLPFLLSILNGKKQSKAPITSVVNATSIDLLYRLLSREDYLTVAEEINHVSDAKNILDFMLYVLHNHYLSDPDGIMDTNRRARGLMTKVVMNARVMPKSLFLTGVTVSIDRENADNGESGPVFKGELRGAPIALRVVHKTRNDIDFRKEALMWRSLNYKFVLPFLGIYEEESASCFFLVSPYMKNGTLAQWRKTANPSTAEIEERILEVAQGIEYIHSEGVIHGDLCGDNILLDDDLHVQIADFGLARLSESTGSHHRTLNYNFAAPELFECVAGDDCASDNNAEKTQKSDVYAFGCLYYEIHYDQISFAGEEELRIKELVSKGELPLRLDEPSLSDGAWDLIQSCWIKQAVDRPGMKEVLGRMEVILKIQRNSDRRPLLSLLSILREREPASSITSVVTTTSIDLFHSLLSRDDYDDAAKAVTDASDAKILLDFMLYVIRNHSSPDPEESLKTKRRARKLMSEIVKKVPVIPNSLVLTGITLPAECSVAGSVVKGGLHGSPVTLKVLTRTRDNDIEFCRKALTWGSLQHSFVLPFLGVYEPQSMSQSFLVTPYTPNGTLAQWRKKTYPRHWEVEKRMLEVARGIRYLHSEGVVHGDLCGDNIFLDSDLHAQIADFGLSQHSDTASQTLRYNFAAPELFEHAKSAGSGSGDTIERTEASD